MENREAIHTNPWEYGFPFPNGDFQQDPRTMAPGYFSRLTGVDGRFMGKLRRFPGFITDVESFPAQINDAEQPSIPRNYSFGTRNGLKLFEAFSLQEDSEKTGLIRGFVFTGNYTRTVARDFIAVHYYRTSTATWRTEVLTEGGTDGTIKITELDVTWDHRNFYVVGTTDAAAPSNVIRECLRFQSGSADDNKWASESLTPFLSSTATTGAYTSPGGGELGSGNATVCLRVIYPEQGLYGALSPFTQVATTAGDYITVSGLGTASSWPTKVFVEYYRTVTSDFVNTGLVGPLYLERELFVAGGAGFPAHDWGRTGTGLADAGVSLQSVLSEEEVSALGTWPGCKRATVYQDIMFIATPAYDTTTDVTYASDTELIRWTVIEKPRLNLLPVNNRRKPPDLSEQVQDIVVCGPYLAVLMDNYIYRVHKSGLKLSWDTIHNKYGVGGRFAHVSIGAQLFLATPLGIVIADLNTGELSLIGMTQHLLDDPARWKEDLASIRAAVDTELGAVIFFNPTKEEALFLWLDSGRVTLLEDMVFDTLTTGVHPVNGGRFRAFFLEETSKKIYQVDVFNDAQTYTMNGGPSTSTYNGTALGTHSTTKLQDTTATFDAGMVGFYVHFLSGANAGLKKAITSLTGTDTINWSGAITAPTNGDRYSIAPIPFRVTMWPLLGGRDQTVLDMFRVDHVRAMTSLWGSLDGDTVGNPNLKVKYQVFGSSVPTTALASGEGDISVLPAATKAATAYAGVLLMPGLEVLSSDLQFDLLGVLVGGSMGSSRNSGS